MADHPMIFSAPMRTERNQGVRPVAQTIDEFLEIVSHAAFRLGALDAARGRPLSHDEIKRRVEIETPPRALAFCGGNPRFWSEDNLEIAQKRYEEGRQIVTRFKLKIRSWSDPRFPPKVVRDWCEVGLKISLAMKANGYPMVTS